MHALSKLGFQSKMSSDTQIVVNVNSMSGGGAFKRNGRGGTVQFLVSYNRGGGGMWSIILPGSQILIHYTFNMVTVLVSGLKVCNYTILEHVPNDV